MTIVQPYCQQRHAMSTCTEVSNEQKPDKFIRLSGTQVANEKCAAARALQQQCILWHV